MVALLEDRTLLATSTISTVAGNGTYGYTGDGGPATAAELSGIVGVAVDAHGNIFLADFNNNVVREVTAAGKIITFAGNGQIGYSGDGGPATAAEFDRPEGVAVDSAGNLFIADGGNNVIREVNASTGIITTVAGNGHPGYSGDGGPATAARLYAPYATAVDAAGDLFIADNGNSVVREVSAATGDITTVAGNGTVGYTGDGGPATAAELADPDGLAVSGNNLYISDTGRYVVRKVDLKSGIITTFAGTGTGGYSGDGGPATAAKLDGPYQIAVDTSGDLFIADTDNNVIREVSAATGTISTVAGNGTEGYSGDGGPATAAELNLPNGIAVDAAGDLFIADTGNYVVRKVTPPATTKSPPQVVGIAPVSSKKGLTSFTVSYNEALNAGSAHNSGLYHVFKGVTKVIKKHRITVFTKALAIKSVSPNSSATMVTITLAKPFKGTVEVQVQGTVTAANGVSNSVVVRQDY
jgi:sugar lactone lactonase YvrE